MKAFIAFSQAPFMKSVITAKDTGTRSLATLPHCIFHRVFNLLTPRELARIDAVCHLWRNLNRDIVGERRWRHLYSSRWPIYHLRPHRWAEQYGKKVIQTSAFKGRFFQDGLYGHKAGVRSVRLLPKNNLLATGSLDKTVKIWDLEQGLQICTSRKHESTVRSLVLKPCDSETARLISGSDGTIRIWTFPFQSPDLRHGPVTKLTGHTGPVSSLSLTGNVLASGSWDCSVRLWSVSGNEWMLKSRFVYPDWIWAVEAKQRHFVVCCGKKLIVQDLENGRETVSFPNVVEEGYLSCCTATEDERLIITGATDGVVRLHDRRSRLQVFFVGLESNHILVDGNCEPWIRNFRSFLRGSMDRSRSSRRNCNFDTSRRTRSNNGTLHCSLFMLLNAVGYNKISSRTQSTASMSKRSRLFARYV